MSTRITTQSNYINNIINKNQNIIDNKFSFHINQTSKNNVKQPLLQYNLSLKPNDFKKIYVSQSNFQSLPYNNLYNLQYYPNCGWC